MRNRSDKNLEGVGRRGEWRRQTDDECFETRQVRNHALRIVRCVLTRNHGDVRPDDIELFQALHTCAYWASGPGRRRVPGATRRRWAQRWRLIRNRLVESNLGLVHSTVARFQSRNVDADSLLSDGMLAFAKAIDGYDPWKGYRFSTYACTCIIRACIRNDQREQRHRRRFGVSYDPSLDRPIDGPDEDKALRVERLQRALAGNLGALTEMESRILSRRFPFSHETRLTFRELAETLGLGEKRVRQIQGAALTKLRRVLEADPDL